MGSVINYVLFILNTFQKYCLILNFKQHGHRYRTNKYILENFTIIFAILILHILLQVVMIILELSHLTWNFNIVNLFFRCLAFNLLGLR